MSSYDRMREVIHGLFEDMPHILDMTIGDYFIGVDAFSLGPKQLEALSRNEHFIIHDFMLMVVNADIRSEAHIDFEYLSEVNRTPMNHLHIFHMLYEAARDRVST